MNCKKYKNTLLKYRDKELTSAQMTNMSQHIEKCSICQNELKYIENYKKLCTQLKSVYLEDEKWGAFTDSLFVKISQQEQIPEKQNFLTQTIVIVRYAAAILIIAMVSIFFFISDLRPLEIEKRYSLDFTPARLTGNQRFKILKHKPVKVNPNIKVVNKQIRGLSKARLSNNELEFLYKNGFVITTREYTSFSALYKDNDKRKIPSFVTIDMAISGFSHILSRLRVALEKEVFLDKLTSFTITLKEQLLLLHRKVPDSAKVASLRALAFIKVASILLDCNDGEWPYYINSKINKSVEDEIKLIYNGKSKKKIGIQKSPIFGYNIDYKRFKIRWNETKEESLRKYYLALEWFTCCVFRSSSISETQSALLILMAAIGDSSEGIIIWEEMNQVITALYGEMDDKHIIDYQKIARGVFGNSISLKVLSDKKKLEQFCKKIDKKKLPRIKSEVGLKGGLRIFGARYYDYWLILQQLCTPYVGDRGCPRIVPSILDIAVIMGHPKAMELAKKNDFYSFSKYGAKVDTYKGRLQRQLHQISRPWEKGGLIGGTWVYESLSQLESKKYPKFCLSDAWQSRKLTSTLCGFVPVFSNKAVFIGKEENAFEGTIDPYPEFFNRMLTRTKNLIKLLNIVGYPMDKPSAKELIAYKNSLDALVKISQKTISGMKLTDNEKKKLGSFALGWQSDYQEANIYELSTLFHRNSTQADFYLHAGLAPVREIWIAYPGNHMYYLTRGGISVLYEFSTARKVLPKQWRQKKIWNAIKKQSNSSPWMKEYTQQEQ